ncbi:MAG: hypothetical protein ACXWU5_07885, partial [Rhodoplanes sp.]
MRKLDSRFVQALGAGRHLSAAFRSFTAAASLKRVDQCGSSRKSSSSFPQLHRCGLIEAGGRERPFDSDQPHQSFVAGRCEPRSSAPHFASESTDLTADPEQLRQGHRPWTGCAEHREAASDIWNLREAYLSLLADIRDPSITLSDMRKRRDELQSQLHKIYRIAPNTNSKACGKVQDA